MNKTIIAAMAASLGFSAIAGANEVIVTPVATGADKVSIAFDLATEGGVGAFNFKVDLPGLQAKAGRVTGCTAELPSGFQGECAVNAGGVYVYAVSNNPEVALPAGVVPIGKVELTYAGARAKLGSAVVPTVGELAVFDNQGRPLAAKSRVEMDVRRPNQNNSRDKQK